MRAVKETKKHNDSHVDLTRQCGKSPVTMSAVLHCVYLAWKHPRRRNEVAFQDCRPTFPPRKRPCLRSKRLKSTMTCTLTSPDNVVSPLSPVTMSAVLYCVYLAWQHPRRQIEVIFQDCRPAFPPRIRPCGRSKRLKSTMTRTLR